MENKTAHRNTTINLSSSKHTYEFSKADRFSGPKAYNHSHVYEQPTYFTSPTRGINKGFGSESKRFGSLGVGLSDAKNWSPTGENYFGYNNSGMMGRSEPGSQAYRDLKNKSVAPTFGVGRENMKKLHVEEILLNKNNRGNSG